MIKRQRRRDTKKWAPTTIDGRCAKCNKPAIHGLMVEHDVSIEIFVPDCDCYGAGLQKYGQAHHQEFDMDDLQ